MQMPTTRVANTNGAMIHLAEAQEDVGEQRDTLGRSEGRQPLEPIQPTPMPAGMAIRLCVDSFNFTNSASPS